MRELVLMNRGAESMNVPSEKVQAYLDEGWKEVSRKPLDPVAAKTDAAESAPVEKPKGKGK